MRADDMITPLQALDKIAEAVIIMDGMSTHKRCAAEGCLKFIPDERRFDARYCSTKCSNREAARRYRARQEDKPEPAEGQAPE